MNGLQPLGGSDPARLGGYELAGVLGRGGQGAVYLGVSPTGERVAVKLLHAHLASDATAQRNFLREVETARQVEEFSTARVLAVGLAGGQPYVISQYVPGESLEALIRREGPRDAGGLHRLAIGTAAALAAIHRAGIVHRDFKPANVLLGPDGPRVIDFGIAKALDSTATTISGVLGTPAYMSPEQAAGLPVGPASDLFSWALTLVYAATGRPAFGSDSVPAVLNRVLHTTPDLSGLPPHLRGLLEHCLDKRPEARPTAHQALMAVLGPTGPSTPPPPGLTPPAGSPAGPTLTAGPPMMTAFAGDPAAPHGAWTPADQHPRGRGGLWAMVGAGAGLLLILGVVAAIMLTSATRTPEVQPLQAGPTQQTSAPPEPATLAGTWTGEYTCTQGVTALTLTITGTPDALKATFAFGADPSNPGVPTGSFAMRGTVEDGVLRLRGDRWIDRPGDYLMVGLLARLAPERPDRLDGTVESDGCTTFSLHRQ
ncbi:serine/threonine-protein kinase [Nonomuraea sp. NPDC050310]|uniref:serine/threonine-protein kinase n=1 Tax=Nonomuraea sp. NPDC050310 TaxID=3154935 RepID=UPI003405A34C